MPISTILFLSAWSAIALAVVANILLVARVMYLRTHRRPLGPLHGWKAGTWIWPLMVVRGREVEDVPLRWILRALQYSYIYGLLVMPTSIALGWNGGS